MIIHCITSGPLETNGYLLVDEKTNEAILIDAPYKSFKGFVSIINQSNLKLTTLLLTHSHLDHIADAACFVKKHPELKVWIHQEDAKNLQKPGSDGIPLFFPIDPVSHYDLFDEGTAFSFCSEPFFVLHTPGHSPGSVCFFFPKQEVLFSGDTLFKSSIGTLSLPTSEPDRMWSSLKKLEVLPKSTKVYPGHGNPTTIGNEKWLKNPKEYLG